ncbi:hypothetical protein GCM10010315_52450 [Streptomyces luteosporeus]|uniref:Uncharacterized protein n=1 Tax=Streptomyces luteosporeus TaxID=173856 RepID=A0ABN3U5D2_9ACTN
MPHPVAFAYAPNRKGSLPSTAERLALRTRSSLFRPKVQGYAVEVPPCPHPKECAAQRARGSYEYAATPES